MILGILGARSKHVEYFSQAVRELFPQGDLIITHLWGQDAPERIGECLKNSDIKTLCNTPEEVIAACDGIIIALRDGTQHAALAEACMKAKTPVFIDKPFTCNFEDARHIFHCSRENSAAFTGGSTLCFTESVRALSAAMPKCKNYSLSYQADPFSPFGGWYFYGSHLTDLCVELFGTDFTRVLAHLKDGQVSVSVRYADFEVNLESSPEPQPLILTADKDYVLDDVGCYKAGMLHFSDIINGKAPGCEQRLLHSVRLLDAVFSSLRSGKAVEL